MREHVHKNYRRTWQQLVNMMLGEVRREMHGCAECARGGERDAKDRRWGNPADTLLYTYLKDVLTSPPLSTDINRLPGTTTMNDTRNNDVNLTLIISHVLPHKTKDGG